MIEPHFIGDADSFARLVHLDQTAESIFLDFKQDLPGGWKARESLPLTEARLEQARDVAQFANTYGGALLLGVRERPLTTTSFA